MLEAAGDRKRFSDCGQIVSVFIESRANSVDVAKRCEEFESAREQSSTLKYLQQSSGTRGEKTLAHRRHYDRACIDQQLCARRTSEVLFARLVEAIAVRVRRDSQQTPVVVP